MPSFPKFFWLEASYYTSTLLDNLVYFSLQIWIWIQKWLCYVLCRGTFMVLYF